MVFLFCHKKVHGITQFLVFPYVVPVQLHLILFHINYLSPTCYIIFMLFVFPDYNSKSELSSIYDKEGNKKIKIRGKLA